jgi:hypothetical protein
VREPRPGDRTRPAEDGFDTNLTNEASVIPITDPLDELARHIDGSFVLIVKVTGGKYRRRCFLTVAAAERAARNAQDAGHNATVFLAELKPLWRVVAP